MNSDLFDQGLAVRRKVLGSDHVDSSLNNATDFTRPMQELVTEYCWGRIWGRQGLAPKNRSMINLAMLTALNRPHEIRVHVRGALNNGVTRDEIVEILLQTAIYCGVPAAMASFRLAQQVFDEIDSEENANHA